MSKGVKLKNIIANRCVKYKILCMSATQEGGCITNNICKNFLENQLKIYPNSDIIIKITNEAQRYKIYESNGRDFVCVLNNYTFTKIKGKHECVNLTQDLYKMCGILFNIANQTNNDEFVFKCIKLDV